MNFKILIARRKSKQLEREARHYRRALRDHLRRESSRIRKLETRARALRLYAGWAAKGSNVIQTHAEDWHQAAAFPEAAPEIGARTPAVA